MRTPGPRTRTALVVAAVLASGAGCAHGGPHGQPTGRFSRDVDDTRVFTAYRQTQATRSETVRLPADARHVRVRIECSGDDRALVKVRVAGRFGAIGCGHPVAGGSFSFRNRTGARGDVPLEIRAPKGSTWSVAIETRRTPWPEGVGS